MVKLGMTKIEILIIALIVGVLGVMAVFAVSSARSSARDAVRLSDVRQTQTGLELFFNDFNGYPAASEAIPLGTASTICLSEGGFTTSCVSANESVYLEAVGAPPTAGLKRRSSCGGLNNAYCYVADEEAYRIQFELENNNALLGLQKGVNCATESGLEPGVCPGIASLTTDESDSN